MNRCRCNGLREDRAVSAVRLVRSCAGGCTGMPWRRRYRLAAGLVVLTFVSGCFNPPRRAAEVTGNPPTATMPSGVPTTVGEAAPPADFWKQSGNLEPQVVLSKGRRAVVTEFDVEFVNLQFQTPLPRQVRFGPLPISASPVHLALEVIGLGRKYSELAEDQQRALASGLYNAFLQDLHRRGLDSVSEDVLLASPAYTELRQQPEVASSPLMVFNVVGSDTGTVLHTRTVAAPGLCVLRGSPRARAAAEARILRETHVDVAVAVRLRVGLFREKPALEQRSEIRLTTCEGSTTLRACHSLVSDLVVTGPTRFRPVVGRIEPVDPGMFSSELTAMLPKFIALALWEPRP
jgi:hypothetical protein